MKVRREMGHEVKLVAHFYAGQTFLSVPGLITICLRLAQDRQESPSCSVLLQGEVVNQYAIYFHRLAADLGW